METMLKNFVVDEHVIESLRTHLNKMIADHSEGELLHPDIIRFSQLLDRFISAYTATNMEQNQ